MGGFLQKNQSLQRQTFCNCVKWAWPRSCVSDPFMEYEHILLKFLACSLGVIGKYILTDSWWGTWNMSSISSMKHICILACKFHFIYFSETNLNFLCVDEMFGVQPPTKFHVNQTNVSCNVILYKIWMCICGICTAP